MASALVQVIKQMQRYIRILRDTRAELAQNAVAEERLRFARDLHDLLGHTMSVIVVKAEVVRRLVEREPALAAEAAADIEQIGRRALTEVREAVNGYRAPEFAVELDSVRTALADAGVSVLVRHDGPPVPPAASRVFGWAIREAATNVIRHSGAKICEITVTVDATAATLEVRDTGYGYRHHAPGSADRAAHTGVGLVGLAERVTAAGGTLATGNASRGGFRVLVTLPATPALSCVDGPDPSMWAVLGDAQRTHGAAEYTTAADTGGRFECLRRPGRIVVIRVLLAEDQGMMRGALALLLGLEPDIEIVAEVGTGDAVVPSAVETKPDVALLDIEMPGMSGLDAAAALREAVPDCRVLILTTFGRPGYLRRAMDAGARGFLVKDAPVEDLAAAIRRVLAGESVVDPMLAAAALSAGPNPLTDREREVLAAAVDGSTIADIAGRLFLSESTVRNYLSAAITKTGTRNRIEAVGVAQSNGWL
jgi:two-component system response regulator DesR